MEQELNQSSEKKNVIHVLDLPAVDLTGLVERECRLTYVQPPMDTWDYYKANDGSPISGRGKRFEVLTWKPVHPSFSRVESKTVKEHFQAQGFYGHTGAFAAWVREHKPIGYHASIPIEDHCLRDTEGVLRVPVSSFQEFRRRLRHVSLLHLWENTWTFVAFREVSDKS